MIKKNRLVALFDILGFGTRLKTDSLAHVRRQLRLLIREIRSQALTNSSSNIQPEDDDNLENARFVFDSVLLVSHPTDNPRNVHNFIFACISLLEFGFKHYFPFRGSLTQSDIFSDEETGLIIGDQFPELRDAESMQEWSGCFIHSRAIDLVIDAVMGNVDVERKKREPLASDAFHWLQVPIKNNFKKWHPLDAWCLNWAYLLEERALAPGVKHMEKDSLKHKNTADYLIKIRALPNDLTLLRGDVPKGTMIKTIRGRHGFRAGFVDQNGNGVGMPANAKLRVKIFSEDAKPLEEQEVTFRQT